MAKIRSIIVDDEPLAIKGLTIRLEEYADIEIVAQSHLLLARVYRDMGESALAEYHAEKYRKAPSPSEG